MSVFTRVRTNLRTKRAAVVLYSLTLVALAAFGAHSLAPRAGGGQAPDAMWTAGILALVGLFIVAQVSRGRLDERLNWMMFLLVVANSLLVVLFLVAYWGPLQGIFNL